jgi:hypothetical protein
LNLGGAAYPSGFFARSKKKLGVSLKTQKKGSSGYCLARYYVGAKQYVSFTWMRSEVKMVLKYFKNNFIFIWWYQLIILSLFYKSNEMIDFSKLVKYKSPEQGEEKMTFKVVNYNEVTERCYIELQSNDFLKPQSLVSINEIINV